MRPYHDPHDVNGGGPHSAHAAPATSTAGRWTASSRQAAYERCRDCVRGPERPGCTQPARTPDVMGYHDGRDIPNYWAYARNFVLQDHMFEPNASWSLPAHLFLVSRVVGELHARTTTR